MTFSTEFTGYVAENPDERSSQTSVDATKSVSKIDFKVKEIVWAKIKGSPHWPAEILAFTSAKMVLVKWFNDYRTTKIYRTQLYKFLTNFDEFAKRFDDTIGLRTAANEALICFGQSLEASMHF